MFLLYCHLITTANRRKQNIYKNISLLKTKKEWNKKISCSFKSSHFCTGSHKKWKIPNFKKNQDLLLKEYSVNKLNSASLYLLGFRQMIGWVWNMHCEVKHFWLLYIYVSVCTEKQILEQRLFKIIKKWIFSESSFKFLMSFRKFYCHFCTFFFFEYNLLYSF